jgi:acetyl esterase/lipase
MGSWLKMQRIRILGMATILAITSVGYSGAVAAAPEVLPIWPSAAPGTSDWSGPEVTSRLTVSKTEQLEMVTNVTVPTLTAFRPPAGTANGTAIIVAPGGGFMNLAVQHEGWDVAKWLADRGVTAFVLKYRVRPWALHLPADARHHPEQLDEAMKSAEPQRQIAAADGIQAMHYLRANAAKLGIRADRVGFMGFSAGAYTTMRVVLDSKADDRPNFAAPIYGAMDDKMPPKDAPPLFVAAAQDDAIVPAAKSIGIFTAWTAADRPAELHVYEKGGHGFGARHLGKPVDAWMTAFGAWLADHGWMTKP